MKVIGTTLAGTVICEMAADAYAALTAFVAAVRLVVNVAGSDGAALMEARRPESPKTPTTPKPVAKKAAKPGPKPTGRTRACVVCGKEFTRKTSAVACSPECRKVNEVANYKKWADKRKDATVASHVPKRDRLQIIKDTANKMGMTEADPLDAANRRARQIASEDGM